MSREDPNEELREILVPAGNGRTLDPKLDAIVGPSAEDAPLTPWIAERVDWHRAQLVEHTTRLAALGDMALLIGRLESEAGRPVLAGDLFTNGLDELERASRRAIVERVLGRSG